MTAIAAPRSYFYFPEFVGPIRYTKLGSLGDTQQAALAQQIIQFTGTAATGTVAALGLAGVLTAATTAAVMPLIGAGVAAVSLAVAAILNSGCGQACIMTSNWANQAEALLVQNIQQYFALPAPRSLSAQSVALANFDNVWAYLVKECGQPGLSTAGQNCVQDRQAGACKWRQTTASPLLQYPGEPQPGECWNWFSGYRNPIANDPNVMPDNLASPTGDTSTSIAGVSLTSGLDTSTLILYAGIGILALGVLGGMG